MSFERLGNRNLQYNIRHHNYGWELTTMDCDFIEFDHKTKKPLALIETKYGLVKKVDLNSFEFDVLCNLSDDRIPVLCLIYYPMDSAGNLVGVEHSENATHFRFAVCGVNKLGRTMFPEITQLSEARWVRELNKLHDAIAAHKVDLCHDWLPCTVPDITYRRD